jgi:hypothetical protein
MSCCCSNVPKTRLKSRFTVTINLFISNILRTLVEYFVNEFLVIQELVSTVPSDLMYWEERH